MTGKAILFINMAKGFGGGEFYTEQLIRNLNGYQRYFLGKPTGKLATHLRKNLPQVHIISLLKAIKLVRTHKNLIIHALDGRGVHFATFLKKISGRPLIITRQVDFPLKRSASQKSYQTADILVGVSKQISKSLSLINPNTATVYGCIKPLEENLEFESFWFTDKPKGLKIAQIGNFQAVKNFPLTITLAEKNPHIHFYLVGSGEQETELKAQARNLHNITFIPFTPYVGSVLKQIDLLIIPSHSEGLGMTILEAYQYNIPVLAHATGGIPEIVEHEQTGFLVHPNHEQEYQTILDYLSATPEKLQLLKEKTSTFLKKQDFSAERMAKEYHMIYQRLFQ